MQIQDASLLLSGKPQPLSEAYFGKNKNIMEIEKNFQIIIDKVNSLPKKERMAANYISFEKYVRSSSILTNIEKLIKKEFKFTKVVVDVNQGFGSVNACTLGRPIQDVFKPLNVIKNNNGVRMVSNNITLVIMIGDLLFFNNFTAGEITAILLHEIGHNFFSNNNLVFSVMLEMDKYLSLLDPDEIVDSSLAAISSMILSTILPELLAQNKKNPLYKEGFTNKMENGIRIFQYFKNLYDDGKNMLGVLSGEKKLGTPLDYIQFKYLKNPFKLKFNMMQSVNEKFADNFVTAYGYGPELSSGMIKLSTSKVFFNNKIIDCIEDIVSLPVTISDTLLDAHPDGLSRIHDQIVYAKEQLNNIESEKLRKELELQIDELEKIQKKFAKEVLVGKMKNGKILSGLFLFLYSIILRGRGPQYLFGKIFSAKDSKTKDWKQFQTSKSLLNP